MRRLVWRGVGVLGGQGNKIATAAELDSVAGCWVEKDVPGVRQVGGSLWPGQKHGMCQTASAGREEQVSFSSSCHDEHVFPAGPGAVSPCRGVRLGQPPAVDDLARRYGANPEVLQRFLEHNSAPVVQAARDGRFIGIWPDGRDE